jgi:hypothetical protein
MTIQGKIDQAKLQAQNPAAIKEEAARYRRAREVLEQLRRYNNLLNPQEYRTIRGQAISGDVEGAKRGLTRLIGERAKL